MPTIDHKKITLSSGRQLAHAEYGAPGGKPIIHCHGAPSSRVEGDLSLHAATATELGLRFILPDRPGIGRSTPQPPDA